MSPTNILHGLEPGEIIRKYRMYQGLTLNDLERISGLNRSYLAKIERGESSPGIINLKKIARALGVSVTHLVGEVPFLSEWPTGE